MKPVLIYSGANDRAVIAFCRYAEKADINYLIVANGDDDLIFHTDYKYKVFYTRNKNSFNIELLRQNIETAKLKLSAEQLFILPSTEYINRFLIEHRDTLLRLNVTFGLCDKELYTVISDKYLFGELCKQYSINVPEEYLVKPNFYPYVIKPKRYFSNNKSVSEKPVIIKSKEDEKTFFLNNKNDDIYFQEYIEGDSIYLLFYFFKDGRYSVYSQKNLIQQHDGGSMVLCSSADYHTDNKLINQYKELFVNEGFSGLLMVEVKKFRGTYYMIEANPRLWGPSQLILDSGMNLFECFSNENEISNYKEITPYRHGIWYFWSGGIVKTQRSRNPLSFYDCNHEYFFNNYHSIISMEVYNRKDTCNIFNKENNIESL